MRYVEQATRKAHLLVVCIAYPGECAHDTDGNSEVRDDTHDKYRVVVVFVVDENKGYTEDEPGKS